MSKIKVSKKNKALAAFEVDKLDNTAPIKKIVEDIRDKNVNAYRLYTKCLGRRPKAVVGKHWSLVGHPVSRYQDDWSGELNSDYFENFYYRSTMPKVITKMKNIEKKDPLTGYMKDKSDWLQAMLSFTRHTEPLLNKYEKLNEEVAYCPQHMVDMVAHHQKDPDPNFDSYYNWYYAGHGNLQLLTLNYTDYLLHSEFNVMYLSEFIQEDSKIITENIVTFDCGDKNNIFETITQDNIIALRTMYTIFILKITHNETLSIDKLKEIHSKMAYTSISFDTLHRNILYTTKLNNELVTVNLDRMRGKTVQLKKPESLVDNWNTVLSVERSYFYHVTPNTVALYDKRSNTEQGCWKHLNDVTDFSCNKITAARKVNDCLYLATYHHLLSLDVRYTGTFKPNILQRWTHNMQSSPTYIYKSCFEINKDILCLASQWCEDMCLIVSDATNMLSGSECSGVHLPYRPPSILTTLKEARFKMLCHDLYNPIDDRLLTSISGMMLLETGERYTVLMQNSLGDVTSHLIYPEHLDLFIDKDSGEQLDEWCKEYKIVQQLFIVSDVINIAKTLKKLKNISGDSSYFNGECSDNEKFSVEELVETFKTETVDSALLEAWGIAGYDDIQDVANLCLNKEE